MKTITECSVELLSHTADPSLLIEQAGRTCYKSEAKCKECADFPEHTWCMECESRAAVFVRKLIKSGHESVLEHASATFRFICDRGVTHELVRHRLCSFSQESTRYCNYYSEITVLRPVGLTELQWERRKAVLSCIEKLYAEEIADGIKPQIARGVLPISLKTEIVHTANFREWRHIMRLRTSTQAHPQIRQMIGEVYNIFNATWPVFVEDIEV